MLLALKIDQVAGLSGFGVQIELVVWVGRDYDRYAVGYLDSVLGEVGDFARVVSHQLDRLYPERVEHVYRRAVLALVIAETEGKVGLHGIQAVVLQAVSSYFVREA